ncbi:MAG: hypothetical protein BGO28_04875 [Alphaproteobacteria bacterium 43-37]|mgnify:CR=1 FL=1|nr:MAG: hypothetical protein BGO28_04875 [Alphaproteobacteria bacterium 43-37]
MQVHFYAPIANLSPLKVYFFFNGSLHTSTDFQRKTTLQPIPSNDLFSKHAKMKRLVEEHRLLDQQIQEMCQDPASNPLHIQRLKKSKLMLKDEIIKLRSRYLPDIIA